MYHASNTLRRATTAAAVAAVAAGLITAGPAAFADPPNSASDQTGQGSGVISLDGVDQAPKTITLITGDKVTLTSAGTAPGAFSTTIDAAPRADGHIPLFVGTGDEDAFYLYPDDARPAVESGVLDKDLFNLTYLAENGYTDADTDSLPVIAQYPKNQSMRAMDASAEALPASEATVELSSVHAFGLAVSKDDAGAFWAAIAPTMAGPTLRPSALPTGIGKLWLDHRTTVSLDESVPMIGAPEAWDLGLDGTGVTVAVLDTGIDENHPDLVGKVVAAKRFDLFGNTSTHDGDGHGTHVASTIAGSGAASDGRYKGVAPGVDLMIGKVLDDTGTGFLSDAVDGMEWAATNGADIISMSLGADPTDGTDLASQAVNDLTESTGTLFVIAAGNAGPGSFTIGAPGAADAALTVAAVDKSDQLPDFSSRGPRLDGAMKPDIAAPGVAISAARAEGTHPEIGGDPNYIGMSGTSMATPHLSGAAAILVQRHPDWTPAELKAALMSTSVDDGYSVYEQGAGRVDVARAVDQTVFATTVNADFGIVPNDAGTLTRPITYRNTGDADVTLTLTPNLRQVGGDPVPDGTLTSDDQVTVPAGGTATTTVTLDASDLAVDTYAGAVVATDETTGTQVRTPVGFRRQPPLHRLTVNVLNRDGQPVNGGFVEAIDITHQLGNFGQFGRWVSTGVFETLVPEGTTHVLADLTWVDESHRESFGYLLDPEVEVSEDTEITLDARDAEKITFDTSRPAEPSPSSGRIEMGWQRTVAADQTHFGFVSAWTAEEFWITPTEPVEQGDLQVYASMALAAPEVTMRVRGAPNPDLHPMTFPHDGAALNGGLYTGEPFTGTHDLELVDAGLGLPEDIAGLDLTGKLALIGLDTGCAVRMERMHNLRDAGAAGVLAWPAHDANTGDCFGGPVIPLGVTFTVDDQDPDIGVPFASIAPAEALALRDRLDQHSVRITVTGTPETPYVYEATPFELGHVPDSLTYDLTDRHVARVDTEFHATEPTQFAPQWLAYADHTVNIQLVQPPAVTGPGSRTRYVGPLSDRVIHQSNGTPFNIWKADLFDEPVRTHTTWNGAAAVTGAATISDTLASTTYPEDPGYHDSVIMCAMCREGDKFYPVFQRAFGTREYEGNFIAPTLTHLYQGDQEIPINTGGAIQSFTMPAEPGDYRLTTSDPGTRTESEWTFHSEGSANETDLANGLYCPTFIDSGTTACRPEPLVYATYDLGDRLGLDNKVRVNGAHKFTINAYHAPSRTDMPEIAGLRLWYSLDDGEHWIPAHTHSKGDGEYEAMINYPPAQRSSGVVSLKLQAWDQAGNTLTQTTTRAFELSDPHTRPSGPTAQ